MQSRRVMDWRPRIGLLLNWNRTPGHWRKVCGLAHVVGLISAISARLVKRLDSEMAIPTREARLFMPGIGEDCGREAHSRFVAPRTTHDGDDGAGRARAAAYEWSVSLLRRIGFDALWPTAFGFIPPSPYRPDPSTAPSLTI